MLEGDDDPRLTGEHVRTVAGEDGTVVLVGVAHDHPASTYRARTVVDRCDPDVLALELPPLAIPLFRAYADDPRSPPALGGEMSAAIQAAGTDRIVGIDGPSRAFLRHLYRTVSAADATPDTLRGVSSGFLTATRRAVACRIAAAVAERTSIRVEVERPRTYDVDVTTAPVGQALDEKRHLQRARAVSGSLVPPAGTRIRDDAREAHMAEQLDRLGDAGLVVAVVGRGHLEPVADRIVSD